METCAAETIQSRRESRRRRPESRFFPTLHAGHRLLFQRCRRQRHLLMEMTFLQTDIEVHAASLTLVLSPQADLPRPLLPRRHDHW